MESRRVSLSMGLVCRVASSLVSDSSSTPDSVSMPDFSLAPVSSLPLSAACPQPPKRQTANTIRIHIIFRRLLINPSFITCSACCIEKLPSSSIFCNLTFPHQMLPKSITYLLPCIYDKTRLSLLFFMSGIFNPYENHDSSCNQKLSKYRMLAQ